ncbi:MAG: outer membrane beta-barrel protein [Polaromonas sp.]
MQSLRPLTRTFSATIVAVAALTAAAGAQAQTNYSLFGPNANYLGLNVGRSDFNSLNNGNGIFPFDKHDTVYGINAGSYFNKNFGLELGYTNFGKVARAGGDTKAQGVNLSLIGTLPLTTSFNLLGKLGTTYSRTDVSSSPLSGVASGSESGFGVSYGIGAEYTFSPQLSAVLQYDAHNMKFADTGRERIGATTVGLRYRF